VASLDLGALLSLKQTVPLTRSSFSFPCLLVTIRLTKASEKVRTHLVAPALVLEESAWHESKKQFKLAAVLLIAVEAKLQGALTGTNLVQSSAKLQQGLVR